MRAMLVLCALVCTASVAAAQPPVGALAIDERQGGQVRLGRGLRDGGQPLGQRALIESAARAAPWC